jgi:hypothetical protein
LYGNKLTVLELDFLVSLPSVRILLVAEYDVGFGFLTHYRDLEANDISEVEPGALASVLNSVEYL